jgi:hypothetical protein
MRQRGKEAYKLKLTNKKYKYYIELESGKWAKIGADACGLAAR